MNTTAEWINGCLDCVRLLRAYDMAHTPPDLDTMRRAVIGHLVAQHRDRLIEDPHCTKCAEFARVLSLRPALLTPTIRGVLMRATDEHRAEHLIHQAPDIHRRRAA